jgi:hypothetical protein
MTGHRIALRMAISTGGLSVTLLFTACSDDGNEGAGPAGQGGKGSGGS